MYLCPCSCSKADCENEEDVLICLPRNLSYAGESYLERYSVSSAFVHNAKLEKQLLQADVDDQYRKAGAAGVAELKKELGEGEGGGREEGEGGGGERDSGEDSSREPLLGARAMAHQPLSCTGDAVFRGGGGPDHCDDPGDTMALSPSPTHPALTSTPTSTTPTLPQLTVSIEREGGSSFEGPLEGYMVNAVTESPDSDLVSEEGIFVNMMDDLEGLGGGAGGKSTLSEASDDTYVSGDSMYYSPVEVDGLDLDDDDPSAFRGHDLRVSLEEAVQQAAFTFHDPATSPTPEDSAHPLSLNTPQTNDWESETDKDGSTSQNTPLQSDDVNDLDVKTADSVVTVNPASEVSTDSKSDAASGTPNTKNTTGSFGMYLTDLTAGREGEEKGPRSTSSFHDLLSPNSPLYEDREFNFARTELRKSTSLKSTKTPPGTPRRKKVVRFADAMGLDLESVRHVLNLESPPKIPPSAMKDLQPGLSEDRKAMGSKFITETFSQPGVDPHFRERVMGEKVVLENALVVSGAITGVVRVANLAFHKTVRVRFTTNGWASFHDIAASYMVNSNDGHTDRFAFTLVPPPDFGPGSRLEFAISFSANGTDYWDNNYGVNYVFECYAKTVPTEAENAWMHFL